MPFPYRLAAIDMDDTLLGPDHDLSPENVDALQRLRDAGVRIVLASGRRHENLVRFYARLGLDGPAISGNGALVRCTDTGDTWYERLMPEAPALALLAEGAALGLTQIVEHRDGHSYVRETTGYSDILTHRTGNVMTVVGDLAARGGVGLRKIVWIADRETVRAQHARMTARWGEALYITITDPEYLEFMAPGVDKAHALEVAAQRLGVPAAHILAFGDGGNDVKMLRWAGRGIAMPHGWEAARAAADEVAPDGDPAGAFARAVDRLLAS